MSYGNELFSSLRLIDISGYSKDELIQILDSLLTRKEKELEEISNDVSTLNDRLNSLYMHNQNLEKVNKELNEKVIKLGSKLKQEFDDKELLINDNKMLENELAHIKKIGVLGGSKSADIKPNIISTISKPDTNSFGFSNLNSNNTSKVIAGNNTNDKSKGFVYAPDKDKDKPESYSTPQSNQSKSKLDKQNNSTALASDNFDYDFMY